MSKEHENIELVQAYVSDTSSDLFLFSGEINSETCDRFLDLVNSKENRQQTVALFLTTYGGDPHSAFRMAKCLKRRYGQTRLLIAGPCKSAGTLMALGVNELAFAETGELGPLDTQIAKPDEILPLNSGLDIFQALSIVTEHAFQCFEGNMLAIIRKSGGNISTKTAAEIASQLVVGMFTPISGQIDPLRLGEVQRAINIAKAYGERLGLPNAKPNALVKMVEEYPSHGFVIDMEEAQKLFNRVEAFSEQENQIYGLLKPILRYPDQSISIYDLGAVFSVPPVEKADEEQADRSTTNIEEVQPPAKGDVGTPTNGGPPIQVGENGNKELRSKAS